MVKYSLLSMNLKHVQNKKDIPFITKCVAYVNENTNDVFVVKTV